MRLRITCTVRPDPSACDVAPIELTNALNLYWVVLYAAGVFVRRLCADIERDASTDPAIDRLLYAWKEEEATDTASNAQPQRRRHLILDTGVYTRNRCFRLFLSCKAGKSEPLLPFTPPLTAATTATSAAAASAAAPTPPPPSGERFRYRPSNKFQYFLSSLVCNTELTPHRFTATGGAARPPPPTSAAAAAPPPPTAAAATDSFPPLSPLQYLTCEETSAGGSSGGGGGGGGGGADLVSAFRFAITPQLPEVSTAIDTGSGVVRSNSNGSSGSGGSTINRTNSAGSGGVSRGSGSGSGMVWHQRTRTADQPSPFPELETFVLELATSEGGGAAFIPSYRYVMESGSGGGRIVTICYNIGGNRWCGRIERSHKSNGKYAVCQLLPPPAAPTDSKQQSAAAFIPSVHFKCHDFDCRNWRSNDFPIDPHTIQQPEPIASPPPPPVPFFAAPAPSHPRAAPMIPTTTAAADISEAEFEAALLALPI